jgi:outer membrane protein assembly factor BamB
VKWKHEEPGGKRGDDQKDWIGSWSTPVTAKVGDTTQVLVSWPGRLAAHEPSTGREIWKCGGLNPLVYTSPLVDAGIAVAMGGFNGNSLAVRTGGSGDVTATHRLWHRERDRQRIGSGVIHDGHVYILNDPGIAECIDLKSGRTVWEERLAGPAGSAPSWSSMVLAAGRLHATNQRGDTFILKAEPTFASLAVNPLGEGTNGSIAVSNGDLFIRTHRTLWCIGSHVPAGPRTAK